MAEPEKTGGHRSGRDSRQLRRRATGFVEFAFMRESSTDGNPLKAEFEVPGYPRQALRTNE